MAAEKLRARVQEHWRAFDALAESQSGANEAIIRALEVFAGARENFSSATDETSLPSPQAGVPGGDRQPSAGVSFPKGSANAGDDGARASYFRAEESLVLAREQLDRSERTLELMAGEVEGARRHIGSCYNAEETRGQEERERIRARASLHALERGDLGCLMSPVDMTRAMASLLRMHQSEIEMQETIVNDVGYNTPGEVLTAYREALSLRAFMDDRFLSQVQELAVIYLRMTYWRRAILAHGCGTILTLGGLAHPLESLNRDHWVPLDSGEGDQTTDVATGAGGSMVYISGYKRAGQLGPDGSQNLQAILMAYNMSGVQQWVVEYGSDGDDEGNSVAADTTGVYLAGAVSVPSNNSGAAEDHDDTDAFVVKYNSTGGLLWETSWGTTELDLGNGVAVDAGSGLVYVVGTTRGSMPTGRDAAGEDDKVGDSGAAEASFESFAVNSGGSDVFLTCLGAADGDIQWTVQFGSAASDVGIRVAVGPRGGVFLIGQLGDDNDQKLAGARAFLAKYDYLGNAQFTARLNSSSTNFAVDLAPSSGSGGEGVVYMSGYTIGDSPEMFLARFEGSTGTQTWLSYLGEEPEVQLIAQAVAVVEGTHHGSDVGGGSDSAVSGSDATVGGNPVVEGDDIVDRGGDARVVVVGYNRSTASTMSHPSTGFTAVADTKGGWEWYTVSREAERETAIAVGAASGSGQSEGDSSVFIVGTVAASEASPGNYMFLDVQSVVREVQPTPPPSRQSKWTPGPTAAVEKVGGASATTGLSQNSSLWLLIIAPIFVVVGCILMTGYVSKQCAIAFGSQPDIPEEPMTPMEFSSHGDRDRDMRRLRDRRTLRPSGSSPSVRQDEVKMRSKSGRRGGEERAWTHSMMAVFREKGDRLPYRKLGEKSRSRLDRQGARELSLRDEEGDEWEGEIELGVTARPSPFDTPRGNGPASGNGLYSDGSNESRGVDGPVDAPHRLEQDPKEAEWTTSFENDDQVGYPKAISNTSGNPRDDEPQEVQPPRSAPFGSPGPSRLLHKAELL